MRTVFARTGAAKLRVRPAVCLTVGLMALLVAASAAVAQAPAGYYSGVDASSASNLRATLHPIIDDHTRFPYTSSSTDVWDIINLADEDPNNSGRIIDVYRNASYSKISGGQGAYNREHTWPSSYGFGNDNSSNYPYTDVHHLFASDTGYNSSRSNKPFETCNAGCMEEPTLANDGRGGGFGIYPGNSNWTSSNRWETWRGRRGDVARAILYMDVRYEGGSHSVTGASEPDLRVTDNVSLIQNTGGNASVAYMGRLSTLLQWHAEDPVDDRERIRNEVVFTFQGNRNPFIDNPQWVACLFQNSCSGGPPPPPPPPPGGGGGDLLITEVLYDVSGSDSNYEWVELYNAGSTTINLSGYSLGYGGSNYTWGRRQLSGSVAPGETFVVGGTTSASKNGNPSFDQRQDFNPDIQNSGSTADGVALFDVQASQINSTTVPIDAVVYGSNNNSGLIDETGSVRAPDVGDAPGNSSIERTDLNGNWRIQSSPTPNAVPFSGGGGTPGGAAQVVLSEVFYDCSGSDNRYEWVELTNLGTAAADLSSYSLGYGGSTYTWGRYQLQGTLPAGATIVVGGTNRASKNHFPGLDQAQDFNPDIQNSGSRADGIALFDVPASQITSSTVPIDAVVYGGSNSSGLIDETGNVRAPDVGDASSGRSIERTSASGSWRIQTSPTPNVRAF